MDSNNKVQHYAMQQLQHSAQDSQQPQSPSSRQQQFMNADLRNNAMPSFASQQVQSPTQDPQALRSQLQREQYSQSSNSINGSNNISTFYENLRFDNSLGTNFMHTIASKKLINYGVLI